MRRRNWPIALAILFVAQLVWYLWYTQRIVEALEDNAEGLSQIYAYVQESLLGVEAPPADDILMNLQTILRGSEVPLVLSGVGDTILSVANLPFEADLAIPEGQARVRDYARELDLRRPPLGDPEVQLVHFGDPPEVRSLRWIPLFQVVGLLITGFLGILSIRVQRRSEAERAWTSMARELAHQLGTPISSLQGWLELLRLEPGERPKEMEEGEIAGELAADLSRLEKISHRFELIGMDPKLEDVSLLGILEGLQRYLKVRIPRGVKLGLDLPSDLPPIRGNATLLTWAFENVLKNALDALGGTGGAIQIRCTRETRKQVLVSISDTGPGVPYEVRRGLFEPGVTTKERGWGVGLALSRRIVEGVHGGRIELGDEGSGGATFHIRLPIQQTSE